MTPYTLLESKEVDVVMGVSEFNHYPTSLDRERQLLGIYVA